jgi:hypothetical protein
VTLDFPSPACTFKLPKGARLLPGPIDLTRADAVGLCVLRVVEYTICNKKRLGNVGRIVRAIDGAHPGTARVCWRDGDENSWFESHFDPALYVVGKPVERAPVNSWAAFTMRPAAAEQ